MRGGKTMNMTRLLVFIALTAPLSAATAADVKSAVDISKWKCKYCVVEEGWSGEIELGLGNVSDQSFKFGEYNGLHEKDGFAVGNADISYRDPDASYLDLSATDIGLDTRSLSIDGGLRGEYNIFIDYDELPHYISNTASTPYTGNGSASLTLPASWVRAGSTGSMTGLTAALNKVDIGTERKRIGTGISYSPDSPWRYDVRFRQDTKEGTQRIAGSFLFNTAQLISPVDYDTEEVDASVAYNTDSWQASLAYYGSTFRNKINSLTWQNAFTPFVAGTDSGQLALAPDNQFSQIILSAGYDLNTHSRISGDIAIGRMEQNENFLSVTQNSSLVVAPLPAGSANAEVDTLNAKLKLTSSPTQKLRLSVAYSHNDRDNKTPRLSYDRVTTDIFVSTPRTNIPYSNTQDSVKIRGDYLVAKKTRLGVGYDVEKYERTFQEIDETTENTLWANVRIRSIEKLFLELKLSRAERDASTYDASAVADIVPPQNSLLRKFNAADRSRSTVGLHVNIVPHENYTIGLNLDITKDDYDKSTLGLTESDQLSINGDVTAMLSENTNINLFLGHEKIESTQSGSQTFSSADWSASNDDTFVNYGVGMSHVIIEDTLDIGADVTRTNSTGEIRFSGGVPGSVFPDLKTGLDSIKIYANYKLQKMMTLRFDYWNEHYNSRDWSLDGVAPNTISNALSFGEPSHAYNVNAAMVSIRYKF